jgi:hypothetical protein
MPSHASKLGLKCSAGPQQYGIGSRTAVRGLGRELFEERRRVADFGCFLPHGACPVTARVVGTPYASEAGLYTPETCKRARQGANMDFTLHTASRAKHQKVTNGGWWVPRRNSSATFTVMSSVDLSSVTGGLVLGHGRGVSWALQTGCFINKAHSQNDAWPRPTMRVI